MDSYIKGIQDGSILSCEYVKLAVQRHVNDLKRQRTKSFPYYFDKEEAQRIITFAEICRHWKGEFAGQRIKLQPHQRFYFGCLFGWKRLDDTRKFRTSYKEVARKNGKTTEAAIKAKFHILSDGEVGAQVYFAATKEEQARIGFDDAVEIAKITPEIKRLVKIFAKSITYQSSFMKPLGADSNTSDGFDPSYGVIDEYHAHSTDGMLNVLESGQASRVQPMIDVITTAGYNKEFPCYANLRSTAISVLKGIKVDESLFAIIYTLDKDDDWNDERLWIKSNPNLGVSVKLSFLRDRYVKAKNEGSTKEVDFKTKNLNVWTDATETWIQDEIWMENRCEYPDLEGLECVGGLDLAATTDFNAFILMFPGEINHLKAYFWIPRNKILKNEDRVDYRGWINDGFLRVHEGDIVDHGKMLTEILEIVEPYNLTGVCYDRNLSYANLIQNLTAAELNLNPLPQTFGFMSEPTKEMERLVYKREFNHGGNPILRWMCSNIHIIIDQNGNIKISKKTSLEKVDGMIALVMAVAQTMTVEPEKKSVYDQEDYGIQTI